MVSHDSLTGPSFSLKNRLSRIVWGFVYFLFFRFSPIPFHRWRAFLLQLFGAKVGKGVRVYPRVKIWAPWNLELADQCGVANGAILYSQGKISIGKRSTVSQGVHLCAGTHDYTQPGFPIKIGTIKVGDFSWIAAEAFVHPGVQIGEGCIIGARSVVTKDMPVWMICTGHPCRPIKERIQEELRDKFRTVGTS